MVDKLRKIIFLLKIKLREKKYRNILPYLYFKSNSDTLLIVFPAFGGNKRRYNYLKAFSDYPIDKLYILDVFAYKGSYFLYEDGTEKPRLITEALIGDILSKKKYKTIITAGTSKGGTCAIYFGLKFGAKEIFSGACQYNLGTYLHRPDNEKIFKSMMGINAGEEEMEKLQNVMPSILEKHRGCTTKIHILYSTEELTYQRQIVDLLAKLKECNMNYIEKVETFTKHNDVGKYFIPYITKVLFGESRL